MHQINAVTSLKVLPVRKVLEKINCFLKGMSIRVGVFFLFYPFTVPFPNTTSIFFTISNTSFSVYCFGALSFSTVLSKCIFILQYLCFLGKNRRCRLYTDFLDDGRYTDAVPSTQTGLVPLFPLVYPDNVKPPGTSWIQTNMIAYNVKYSYRYWSHIRTPSFQSFAISSMSGSRNKSISVPSCFGPWIRIDNIRYFLL
jgi:hypothetical protein